MSKTARTTLIRTLGLFSGTLVVAGVMIGSGVFKKIVPMAQTGLSEAWILAAWVIAGMISMLGAFNITGLSSLTEQSGGVYEYLRLAFGDFLSFIFGWTDFTIIGSASIAALGFIFSQTINTLIPLPNPLHHWKDISLGRFIFPFADSGIKTLSISTICLITWVNYRGARESSILNSIFTSTKILGILTLIIFGLFLVSPVQPKLEFPRSSVDISPITASFSAFFGAILSALWAYDGWLDLTFITGEIKNPKRNVPLAIIIGISIAILLYVMVNYTYMKVLPLNELAAVGRNEIGAAAIAQTLLGSAGKYLIIILIMVSVFGSLNAVILSHTRIYFRMAQEQFFFQKAARVHPVHRTPYVALVYTMIWSCLLVISGTFDILTDMVIFANFLFYGLLAVALLKMKRTGVITAKTIGYPVIQIIIILFSLALISNTIVMAPKQSFAGIGLVLSGIPFYYYFKKRSIIITR